MLKTLVAVAVVGFSFQISFAMDITGARRSDNFEDRGITDDVRMRVAPFFMSRLEGVAGTSHLYYEIQNRQLTVNIRTRNEREKIVRLTAVFDSFGSVNQLSPVISNMNISPANNDVDGELLNDSISFQNVNDRDDLADYLCEEIFGRNYSSSVATVLRGRNNLLGPGQSLDTLQCSYVAPQTAEAD